MVARDTTPVGQIEHMGRIIAGEKCVCGRRAPLDLGLLGCAGVQHSTGVMHAAVRCAPVTGSKLFTLAILKLLQ
jgi:hypothetical protein